MSNFIINSLQEMIENIIIEELASANKIQLTEWVDDPLAPDDNPLASHNLQNLLKKDKKAKGQASSEDVEKILAALVARRGGRATLKRSDMERLDMLTRWMKWIPGGTKYRRNLAKYLRTPVPKSKDNFSDFRRYSYGTGENE